MLTVRDQIGRTLDCDIAPIATAIWGEVGGIYGYLRPAGQYWVVEYVGRAINLRKRHHDHHIHSKAIHLGCSHFFAVKLATEHDRKDWEQALYDHYRPSLNSVRPDGPWSSDFSGLAAAFGPSALNAYQGAVAQNILDMNSRPATTIGLLSQLPRTR